MDKKRKRGQYMEISEDLEGLMAAFDYFEENGLF